LVHNLEREGECIVECNYFYKGGKLFKIIPKNLKICFEKHDDFYYCKLKGDGEGEAHKVDECRSSQEGFFEAGMNIAKYIKDIKYMGSVEIGGNRMNTPDLEDFLFILGDIGIAPRLSN
jgi:hypothetical protein